MLPPMQHHGAGQQQPMQPHRPVPVPPHHRGLEEMRCVHALARGARAAADLPPAFRSPRFL